MAVRKYLLGALNVEDSLYIVMPAYNEQDSLEKVVNDWYKIIDEHSADGKSKLVVVNDGSKDDTLVIGQKLMDKYPNFEIIDKSNSGHGPTVLFAYKYAIQNGADYIFQTDSDGQTNPLEFENFWNMRKKYDAIIGDRQDSRQDGKDRVFVEKVVCILVKLIFGVDVPDANAPFRLMKTDLVKKYIDIMPQDFNIPNIVFTAAFVYFKEKVKFVKISFEQRSAGVNSINIKKICAIGIKAVGDFIKIKKNMKKMQKML